MCTAATTTINFSLMPAQPYGLIATFEKTPDLYRAAEQVRDAGYRNWDCITPFPVHGLDKAMGLRRSIVPRISLAGGITGFITGMTMIWWTGAVDYPIIVGGKPLFSPMFAFPVSYELTILLGAFGTLFGMLFLNRLPKLYHPLLKARRFAGVTHDKFVIAIETSDPKYSATETRKLLESAGSKHIELVED